MNSLTYFKKQSEIINTDLTDNLAIIKNHGNKTHENNMRYENIVFFCASFITGMVLQKKINRKHRAYHGSYNTPYEKKKFSQSFIKVLYTFIETKLIHDLIK